MVTTVYKKINKKELMVHSLQFCHPSRVAFDLPELLDIQRAGFNRFLKQGISNLFLQIPPIKVEHDNFILQLFLDGTKYQLILPDDNPRDCILKMKTYSCKLYVKAKIVFSTKSGKILETTKDEWILIGHLPIMTKRGHFIINGSPRVIVHQVVRSPGIYFQQVLDKEENKRIRFYGDIIPFRGVWLRLQITKKGKIEAKLKKGKKVSALMLQECLQFIERHNQSIEFNNQKVTNNNLQFIQKQSDYTNLLLNSNIVSLSQNNLHPPQFAFSDFHSKNVKSASLKHTLGILNFKTIPESEKRKISKKITYTRRQRLLDLDPTTKLKSTDFLLNNSLTPQENKALLYTYDKLYRPAEDKEKEEISKKGRNRSFQHFGLADNSLKLKKCYKNLSSTFKEKDRYNLSDLGREKINTKLGIHIFETQLTALDIKTASHWLHKLTKGEKSVDDIDHFQNRRIRTSGELLEIQFENGIDRLTKLAWNKLKEYVNSKFIYSQRSFTVDYKNKVLDSIKSNKFTKLKGKKIETDSLYGFSSVEETAPLIELFGTQNSKNIIKKSKNSFLTKISLKDLLSTKPINGALRELFGANPLSQYMDQTNPLAEITHKRRMSSLGIGGVSRESAGMAIRGIHPTHYGRICPIETPEGKNAGLVNSLAFFSKINEKGFIETPYYKVIKGQVQPELGFTFFSAKRESLSHLNIAPSDLQQSLNNKLTTNSVPVRVADNLLDLFQKTSSDNVDCIGVSPIQMISVATSLIPFLEHNDANRALMGSNMQRQAVPLMIPERPIVGTGLESLVVTESGHIRQAELTGFVSYVSANKIIVESLDFFTKSVSVFDSYSKSSLKEKKRKMLFKRSLISNTLLNSKIFSSFNYSDGIDYKTKNKKLGQTFLNKVLNSFKSSSKITRIKNKRDSNRHIFQPHKKSHNQLFLFSQENEFNNIVLRHQKVKQNTENLFRVKNSDKTEQKRVFKVGYNLVLPAVKFSFSENNTFTSLMSSATTIDLTLQNSTESFPSLKFFDLKNQKTNYYSTLFQQAKAHKNRFKQLMPSIHLINNFARSNQDTCLMQRASIKEGDWVQKGDILTDCSASDKGELSVGKNILVAYMPWEGYNFEDAIVINERLVQEDVYTSLHIERYDFNAQDVKEGNEWFTKDLPGISSKKVKHLDDFGLPKIGSFVQEGDILIGKMKYSNKKPTTPYERLLCDILGENNFSARDSSLYVPKGVHARVIKHQILALSEKPIRKSHFSNTLHEETKICNLSFRQTNICQSSFKYVNHDPIRFHTESYKPKIPKIVHIFLGEKRPIQVGDKMSGRHGNKGVVATILPKQDMPYLTDGTPIDIILNPLGVPSRMNVGQVFESLLGLAGTFLEQHFKITAFDERYGIEASQSLVYLKLYQARLQSGQNWLFQIDFPGKTRLIDGRSGQCFDQWVTVGRAYILKLIHMVNEKIHARATGPYALITQQPLRGRSQKGGQRLGEMEVWALEGFGAAYTLQELLTKKSDDIVGRKEVASSILPRPFSIFDKIQFFNNRRENRLMLGQPEIFKVLICELQALCLDVGVYSFTTKSFKRNFLDKVN